MFTERLDLLRAGLSARGRVRSDRRRRFLRRRLHGLPRAHGRPRATTNLRRAVVYGSAMGSFAVERFSDRSGCSRSRRPTSRARVAASSSGSSRSRRSVRMSDERPLDYASAGVDIDAADAAKQRIRARGRVDVHRGRARRVRRVRRHVPRARRVPASGARLQRRRRRHQDQASRSRPAATTPSATTSSTTASTTSSCRVRVPLFFLDYVAVRAARARRSSRRSSRASPRAAARTGARSSAARRRRCRASTRRRTTTSRASSSVCVEEDAILGADRVREGRRASSASPAAGCTPTATRSRDASSPSGCSLRVDDEFPGESAQRGRRAAPRPSLVPAAAQTDSAQDPCAWPTSPAADCRAT